MSTKPVYKKMKIEDLNPNKRNEVWSAKIDGAHTIINMKPGEVPVHMSHRISKKTGDNINYTQKLPHIKSKSLYDARIRGETYAFDKNGKAVHPDIVTAILNSGIQKSLALQKKLGVKTTTALIDVDEFNGEDVSKSPFIEKRKILEQIALSNPEYHLPDTAYTPPQKKKMLEDILAKKHLQTSEGIIVHNLTGEGKPFTKAKVIDHHDVYITGIFPEENVKEGRKVMAGGFTYSWNPDGETVGKVGTGFNHDEKVDMINNPKKYIGRAAKVKALGVSKNKALVKPSFDGWHIEKNIGVEKMALIEKTALTAQKARDMAKSIGLIPEGQWKWALRKLKGKVGNEKALSEAKAKLGSLSNHELQALDRASRKAGGHKEVGAGVEGKIHKKDIVTGSEGGVPFDFDQMLSRTVHTHPIAGEILNKSYAKDPVKFVKDYLKSMGQPPNKAMVKKIERAFSKSPALAKLNVSTAERLIGKNYKTVSPSGNLPSKVDSGISGDFALYQANRRSNNIYSPELRLEGIYKVKTALNPKNSNMPEFKARSIYFDRGFKKIRKEAAEKYNPLKDPHHRNSLIHVSENEGIDPLEHKKKVRENNKLLHSILEKAYNLKHLSKGGKSKLLHLTADIKYSPNKKVVASIGENDFASKKIADKYSKYFDALYNNKLEREEIEKSASSKKQRRKVYAVDFDGTIVENAYPRIGKLKPETVDFIKKVHGRGDKVIVWTSRSKKPLINMEKFLKWNKIPYHEINQNSSFKTDSPKIIADYYIDDKAVNVTDLHKIAGIPKLIEKLSTYPVSGMVKRTMSGLTQKKVISAAPLPIKPVVNLENTKIK